MDLWSRFRRELPGHIDPDPEAARLLRSLEAAGLPFAVLSNGGGAFQRAKLRAAGLADLVPAEKLLISGEIGVSKPEPAAFEALTKVLGGIPPSETLFVGDHPVNDIGAAKAAGFQTCWIARNRPVPEGLSADRKISTLAGVFPAFLSK